jgi:hypothetical protein
MFEQDRKTFQLRERRRYSDEATDWTICGSNSGTGESLFSLLQNDKAGGEFLPTSNLVSKWKYFSRGRRAIA